MAVRHMRVDSGVTVVSHTLVDSGVLVVKGLNLMSYLHDLSARWYHSKHSTLKRLNLAIVWIPHLVKLNSI